MYKRRIVLIIMVFVILEGAYNLFYLNNNKEQGSNFQSSMDFENEMTREDTNSKDNKDNVSKEKEEIQSNSILNEAGVTIKERYNPPSGFKRISIEEGSFEAFLRNQKLKPYGDKVLYYDGKIKNSKGVYDSVLDVQIGDRDLHQCADAIMLLRAEYFYTYGKYDEISFNFTNGFKADYQKWLEGYRIQVKGNDVTWSKEASYNDDYTNFRKYMDLVFAYAGTMSLDKQLKPINSEEMTIGDIFIKGGSPGHGVIVVDMAKNEETGEKLFILAQSYMPAQQTQILINPNDKDISPWYRLTDEEQLITPEWQFEINQLKRFQ